VEKNGKSDLAEKIVSDIVEDLTDRSGIGDAFEDCDEDIQKEIKDTWERIVRRHIK